MGARGAGIEVRSVTLLAGGRILVAVAAAGKLAPEACRGRRPIADGRVDGRGDRSRAVDSWECPAVAFLDSNFNHSVAATGVLAGGQTGVRVVKVAVVTLLAGVRIDAVSTITQRTIVLTPSGGVRWIALLVGEGTDQVQEPVAALGDLAPAHTVVDGTSIPIVALLASPRVSSSIAAPALLAVGSAGGIGSVGVSSAVIALLYPPLDDAVSAGGEFAVIAAPVRVDGIAVVALLPERRIDQTVTVLGEGAIAITLRGVAAGVTLLAGLLDAVAALHARSRRNVEVDEGACRPGRHAVDGADLQLNQTPLSRCRVETAEFNAGRKVAHAERRLVFGMRCGIQRQELL